MPITTETAANLGVCYNSGMSGLPPPCQRQQELMSEVQQHLVRLAELARAEVEAINTKDEKVWMAIDKQIEATLGDKERSLGALRAHRSEHGC